PALYREARAVAPIASVQNACHVGRDNRLLDETTRDGVAFIAMLPLASGALIRAAASATCTPAQLALAWLLHRAPNVIPIPGTGSLAHLEENMGAAAVALPPGERAQ